MAATTSTTLSEATITAIFTAAAGATNWQRSNLGLSTRVALDGLDWTVRLPREGAGRAYISGSSGRGGDTAEYIEATWLDTFRIVEAAMAATRVH